MKIGILTHQLYTNYGGILQNFALQKLLEEIGCSPLTIDYYTRTSTRIKILSFLSRLLKRLKGERIPLRGWPTEKESNILSKYTRRFVAENIRTTDRMPLDKICRVKKYGFDAIIVGSDQVWRGGAREVERFYLSDFTDQTIIKVAYAASFGVEKWNYTPAQTLECKKLVKQFKAISVRERDAKELLENNLSVKADFVLDPTLMIERRYYENLVKKENVNVKNDARAMIYILDKSEEKERIVAKICEQEGLWPHSVMAKYHFGSVNAFNIDDCVFPSVEDWIEGFMNSDYVITDSFHGTVFAIIFNKPFVTIVNNRRGKSRFDSILGMLHLEDRLIGNESELDKAMAKQIDWEVVNAILAKQRECSLNFLMNALN